MEQYAPPGRRVGGTIVDRMNLVATQDRRAARITVGVDATARELAGHITAMHGGYRIDPMRDVAKRTRGKDPDFEEMSALHDALHVKALTGEHIMRFAHHHDPTFKS